MFPLPTVYNTIISLKLFLRLTSRDVRSDEFLLIGIIIQRPLYQCEDLKCFDYCSKSLPEKLKTSSEVNFVCIYDLCTPKINVAADKLPTGVLFKTQF